MTQSHVSAGRRNRLNNSIPRKLGKNVANFCDDLIKESETTFDSYQESINEKVSKAINKAMKKSSWLLKIIEEEVYLEAIRNLLSNQPVGNDIWIDKFMNHMILLS